MAEQLCELKKKGGGGSMSETLLWTNNAPTSSFAGQSISLSRSMLDFDFIKVEWRVSTTNSSTKAALMSVSELYGSANGTVEPHLAICSQKASNTLIFRHITNVNTGESANANSMRFGLGFSINTATLATVSDNASSIPVNVYGLK